MVVMNEKDLNMMLLGSYERDFDTTWSIHTSFVSTPTHQVYYANPQYPSIGPFSTFTSYHAEDSST